MKHFTITLLLLLLLPLEMSSAMKPAKRALVFGLGPYQDKNWRTIHGDNDVVFVKRMLAECGFMDVVTLKNEKATKKAMADAFTALAARCQKGDVVYIHYSGHGQLMTDLDGDESLRTTMKHGQWDEAWVPYDAYLTYGDKDRGEKHFCDDEVEQFLSAIRQKIGTEGKMYVVIDSCHSGDATCGELDEYVRGIDQPFEMPMNAKVKPATEVKPEQWLTVSACQAYQLASEMKSMKVGKLTFAICSMGREFFTLKKEELQKRLTTFMTLNKGRLPQDPVVSGQE